MSGIFRDVNLLRFPRSHIQDFQVQTDLDEKYVDATLKVDVELSGEGDGNVKITLFDKAKTTVVTESSIEIKPGQKKAGVSLPLQSPAKWTAEDPNLYHLVLQYNNQVIAQKVGFRKVEMKDGLIQVNGKRVVFRGVNRHEHHPTGGRSVPFEFLKTDLLLMKTHNINAIRTSHQPNDTRLYDLADELGFWVMDEADLECHGFDTVHENSLPLAEQTKSFEEKKAITYGRAGKWLSDNKDWEEAYVDRARQMVHRDKNHPSIVIWSLGNEAFYGKNFQSMYDWIKSCDNTRPVHYEGDVQAQTVDMFSLMYPELSIMKDFAKNWDGKKPLILCEFIHAMGNGPGNMKEYIDLFYEHACLQGGWVWEWANHGLLTQNNEGKPYYAYGGDFGEFPHDGNFVMDGLVDSQHRPAPGLIEYKKAIEPVQIVKHTSEVITIINRYDFVSLAHLRCTYSTVLDGVRKEGAELELPVLGPGETADLAIPKIEIASETKEAFLELNFVLKESTSWAESGHEVAWLQVPLPVSQTSSKDKQPQDGKVTITKLNKESPSILAIQSPYSNWTFDLIRGRLTTWTKSNTSLLTKGPELTFWRAPTDNDGHAAKDWYAKLVNHLSAHTRSVTWDDGSQSTNSDGNTATITCVQRIAPPTLEWSVDATTTYTFTLTDVTIHVKGTPQGQNLPRTLPRIGLTLSLPSTFTSTTWLGLGPGESYKDKKLSQKIGTYSSPVDELTYQYEFPQESGNHTNTRWVEFETANKKTGLKAEFLVGKKDGFDFQASHFEVKDVEMCGHPFELEKAGKEEVIVRLDFDHHGLGSGSCGKSTFSLCF